MHTIRLAVDVMGGDYGTRTIIAGIVEARSLTTWPFSVRLCGNEKTIREVLSLLQDETGFEIENCPDYIGQNDIAARSWKQKSGSPIVRAITLQAEGLVDATVSAGDTRVLLGAAIFILGRLPDVTRPALAAFVPTITGRPTLLLDVGANLNCRTEHLVTFGRLGFEYQKLFFDGYLPTVALLNIGKEPYKGTSAILESAELLNSQLSTFRGFVEGSQVLRGETDVIVCDGFTGNVLLKACESFFPLTMAVLGDDAKLGAQIREKMTILNPEHYGAAPLLGIAGTVLKAHGCSSSGAIARSIVRAVDTVRAGRG
jgi:glycerol-3-phosphate acyltransferase PlsX